MDSTVLELIFGLIVLIIGLGLVPFYICMGLYIENKMLKQVEQDEKELAHIKVLEVKTVPEKYIQNGCTSQMVCGSITVASNYLRSYFASWRNIFGGEIKSYTLLLDIARRTAMVRMKREAEKLHADCIINIKYATANIMSSNTSASGTSVEVLVYGTALIS